MDAHVLALQETFLDSSSPFSLPRFVTYRHDRALRRGGGVALCVADYLSSCQINVPLDGSSGVEVIAVRVMWPLNHRVTVVSLYSPSGRFSRPWLDRLFLSLSPPFLILGDFNCRHTLWGAPSNSPGADLVANWILEQDLCVLNASTPTRVNPRGGSSLLDLSICSADISADSEATVQSDPFDSDHLPVLIRVHLGPPPSPSRVLRIRYHWGRIQQSLTSGFESSQPATYDGFQQLCHSAMSSGRQSQCMSIRSGAPWWNSKCAFLLGQKRRFLRLARATCNRDHWVTHKKFAGLLKREIRSATRNYWQHVCHRAAQRDSIFRLLNSIQRSATCTPSSHLVLHSPRGDITSARAQASLFAQHFSSSGPEDCIPFAYGSGDAGLPQGPFSLGDLQSAIDQAPCGAIGYDGIHSRVLKGLNPQCLDILLSILNNCWSHAEVPSDWKISMLVPLLKPGKDASDVRSYRPIALTSVVAKTFERMLHERLLEWILPRDLFHTNHFGFLPFRDCSAALSQLMHILSAARDSRQFVVMVSLDIQAAYDSVWSDGLVYKLIMAGLGGPTARWIHHFICGRSIRVKWRGSVSPAVPSIRGIPQGGVLSPLLFMLYLRDIFETAAFGVNILVYADDIFVVGCGETLQRVKQSITATLANLDAWCRYWKLALDPRKCSAINFSRRRTEADFHLSVSGCPITWVTTTRILGVTFSRNLTWKAHFNTLKTKAMKKLRFIKYVAHLHRGIRSSVLLRVVNSAVRGPLDFCCAVHSSACVTEKRKLGVVYNSAIRVSTGLPAWTPIPVLYREAGAWPLDTWHRCLSWRFVLRHFSLSRFSPLFDLLRAPLGRGLLATVWDELSSFCGSDLPHIIRWTLPRRAHLDGRLFIHSCDYAFQSRNLPPVVIRQLYHAQSADWRNCQCIATDASKVNGKVSVGVWNASSGEGWSQGLAVCNSIFSAEAFAIRYGLSLAVGDNDIVLLSDSLSVLKALHHVNRKSPTVIIWLHNSLVEALNQWRSISLVWVPGHVGIPPNEKADALARSHSDPMQLLPWVSPEDLAANIKRHFCAEVNSAWRNCQYAQRFGHLGPKSWLRRNWHLDRWGDVQLSRLRTRSLPTFALLHKVGLHPSPLCPACQVPDTHDHFLLECRRYRRQRRQLLLDLRLAPGLSLSLSFSLLCDLDSDGGFAHARALRAFLASCCRF